MRWLIIAAVAIAAALGYLAWTLSRVSPPPTVTPVETERRDEPVVRADAAVVVAVAPSPPPPSVTPDAPPAEPREVRPVAKSEPRPTLDVGSGSGSAAVPERQLPRRRVRLRATEQRFESRNYAAAAEEGLKLLARYPDMIDGYKVTVAALCALGDMDRARELFAKVKPEDVREGIKTKCKELGATLTP